MLERRGFLRGLASLPMIGGSVALIGKPTAAAVPVSTALMDGYVAFLAHEHMNALRERYPGVQPPMYWLPDDVCARDYTRQVLPSTRAAIVLSAAGMPVLGGLQ